VGFAVVLILGLVAGGVTTWMVTRSDSGPAAGSRQARSEKKAAPKTPPATPVTTPDAAQGPAPRPVVPPGQPGLEPPTAGGWPASWATFAASDQTKKMDLAGMDFAFRVPDGWRCTNAEQPGTQAKWACGGASPADAVPGGYVTVRKCAVPCDAARKIEMRKTENAWGLRWVRADDHTAYVETTKLKGKNGESRYGLVLVRYWHRGSQLDRQLVVRMSAPMAQKAGLQKIVNDMRTAVR
jgi:hypothetical protein